MEDIDVGSRKSKKAHSRSFGGTVWVRETEHHKWQAARNAIVTQTGRSGHVVLYQAAWIGFQLWQVAIDKDYTLEDLRSAVLHMLADLGSEKFSDAVPSDVLAAWANERGLVYDRLKERDEALLRVLDQEGLEKFSEEAKKRDPSFDVVAWMRRTGLAYDLSWTEKARRLLAAFLAKRGETERDDVIVWAEEVGLIGDETKKGNLASLIRVASEFGFSGAGRHGYWALPDRMRTEIPDIDVDSFGKESDLIEMFKDGDKQILVS